MTLRRTLIVGVLGLVAIVAVIIGVISTVTLNGFLVERLDNQLPGAQTRSQSDVTTPPPGLARDVQGFLDRQTPGTVGVVLVNGVVAASGAIDSSGNVVSLSNGQITSLAAVVGNTPRTVSLGGSLGDFRVSSTQFGSDQRIVIGLSLAEVHATIGQQIIVVVAVTAVMLLIAALAAGLWISLALRPLARVADTASRVAELPLDRGEVALAERVPERDTDAGTEVGRVGYAVNRMLDHITAALTARQRSENRVRQFVADASHELRTPLASIRGYAELTRRGGFELPDDVSHSLGRIESEAVRMTTLVEDLLLLARLDSRPDVASDDVDLTSLVVDAVGDAHATAPDHRWILELSDQPVHVAGDSPRLFQVISNLLANARQHTPEGTTVTIELTEDTADGTAALIVADDGPGIPPELSDDLFGRFVRGDQSRNRHSGSTGLGLAIVTAVVEAHKGRVSVSSAPGRTEFRVVLPLVRDGAPVG